MQQQQQYHLEKFTSFYTTTTTINLPENTAFDPLTGAYVIDDDAHEPTFGYIVMYGEQPPYLVEVQRRSGSGRATSELYNHLLKTTPGATPYVQPGPRLDLPCGAPQPSPLLSPLPAALGVCELDEPTVDAILAMARSPLVDVAHEGWLSLARSVAASENNARFVYVYAGMDGKLLDDIDKLLDGRIGDSAQLLGARILEHVYSGRTVAVPLCMKHSKSKKTLVGRMVHRRVARTLS